jgi:predicted DNA-binding transcriptional regulator YafY
MLQTSARLLELLRLLQGRRSWAGGELAERLEVTTRTLRRDIDKLRSIGYPIDSTSGTEGGYRLGAGSTMQPLLLEDDEAVAVALGLGSAAAGSVEGMEEASMRALSKIEQVLPDRLARRVAAFQSTIVRPAGARSGADARTLATIAGACRDEQTLRFRYRDRAGAASVRSVEPHRLVHTGYRWYLVAWDGDRRDWRTFRVDRIQQRVAAGARFTPREPPAQDLAEYVSRGVAYAPPCRARVKVRAAAETVAKRLPPFGAGLVEPIDDASCYLELGAGCFDGLAMHLSLLGLDFEVEVDGPTELIEAVRRLASRLERAVSERSRPNTGECAPSPAVQCRP